MVMFVAHSSSLPAKLRRYGTQVEEHTMSGSIEQFIILILGAFTIIVVITLALQPWISWVQAIPILLSLLALIVAGFTMYFTFFWHFSDLLVYLRFPELKQLGTNTLDVNYFFSNMGNQTAFVEDVAVDELWMKSDDPGVIMGVGSEVDRCSDANLLVPTSMAFETFMPSRLPSLIGRQHFPLFPTIRGPDTVKGVLFELFKPAKIYIDGAEAKTAAATVEAGKMKVISATFEMEPLPVAEYNVAVVCPVIRIFDSKGQPILAVCKGSKFGHLNAPNAVFDAVYGLPEGSPPGRLLPVSSKGNCRTFPMSGNAP
jgi:hypothetical protein